MKLAAVLVPLALFLLPTILHAIVAGWLGIQGKEDKLSQPISKRGRKQLLIATFIYMSIIFPISIAWSVYVFTHNVWFSALAYFIWMIPVAITIPMSRHMSATLPKPPQGGWPDDKTRADAFRKWQIDQEERRYKNLSSPKWWGKVLLALLAVMLLMTAIAIILVNIYD